MFTKGTLFDRICIDKSCQCAIINNNNESNSQDSFFLVGQPSSQVMRGYTESLFHHQGTKKARKSLKPQKSNKQNDISNASSNIFKQQPTCYSSNNFYDHKNDRNNKQIPNKRSSIQPKLSSFGMKTNYTNFTPGQKNFEVNMSQATEKKYQIKRNPLQVRFSSNNTMKNQQHKQVTQLKLISKLDRAQSSQNLNIPKLIIPREFPSKIGAQWKSQYVNIELQKSASKPTHRLTELNFKYTQSVNDEQSLRISQVVSDSSSQISESNRTETFPKRIKDLLHLKYSKIQGKKR